MEILLWFTAYATIGVLFATWLIDTKYAWGDDETYSLMYLSIVVLSWPLLLVMFVVLFVLEMRGQRKDRA